MRPDSPAADPAGRPTGTASRSVAGVTGVTKRFGLTEALRDVSLAVERGESHGLVGRNGAGKSTLVAVLTGLLRPDAGEVWFGGEPAPAFAQRERWRERVACVYQRSTVIPSLTVAENLVLNAYPEERRGVVRWGSLRREARALLDEWGLDVKVDRLASELTVGQRQLVEIARALRLGTRFMILDEPTAQLDAREIARLFERIGRLREEGVSFLYISHHLSEIYELCQRVTVLRDGRWIATEPVAGLGKDELVRAMVGQQASFRATGARRGGIADSARGDVRLEVRGLGVEGWCRSVSFDVRAGERVGLAGLAGCGKAQVADAIVGLLKPDRGEVLVGGRRLRPGRVDRAIESGVGYVPEDRHVRGLTPNLSVEENLTLPLLGRLGRAGLVDPRRRQRRARQLFDRLGIVARTLRQHVSQLSGGNQQKTVLGRALARGPGVLVLVHPTAGVDIASKDALFETIRDTPDVAALVVSDELDELAICDRVLVMFGGELVREFGRDWQDDELVATMEGVQ
jgi:simple sugar transport system ATP-binding protein